MAHLLVDAERPYRRQFICVETSLITQASTINFEFIHPWIKILRPIAQSNNSAS